MFIRIILLILFLFPTSVFAQNNVSPASGQAVTCSSLLSPPTGELCVDSTMGLEVWSGSAWFPVTAGPASVVSGLPTCNAALTYKEYFVTDALTPVALATVVGLGAIKVKVFCNGANWIVE